jgi:hypothetical protein
MWSSTRPRSGLKVAMALALAAAAAAPAGAQVRFQADPEESLAWWQLNPHLNHLWATTCPQDPSWRPGEGVSITGAAAYVSSLQKRFGYAAMMDTIIPLYPRRRVRAVCPEGVKAELTVRDTARWQGVQGKVTIAAEKVMTGLSMRDAFYRGVLETDRFREITYQIDSVVSVVPGDTLKGVAVGQLTLHGVTQPHRVPIMAWREGSGLRVQGKLMVPSNDMTEVYGLSKMRLGLGGMVWKELHMGLDLVLVKTGGSGPPPQ